MVELLGMVAGHDRHAMIAPHCRELKKMDHSSTSPRAAHGQADDGQATRRLTEWRTLINNCITYRHALSE
jgi:hypothetical protein